MINLAHRIRGLFGASQGAGADGSLAPDPEWDELVAWAVALPGGRHDFDDDSALSFVRADESDWVEALARAKAREFDEEAEGEAAQERGETPVLAAVPAAEASVTPPPVVSGDSASTWSEGLAQARARRLAEDAEWSACLQRAKASRIREEDDDAEWLECLQRAKAGAAAAAADEDAEWSATLARVKAGAQPHAR